MEHKKDAIKAANEIIDDHKSKGLFKSEAIIASIVTVETMLRCIPSLRTNLSNFI